MARICVFCSKSKVTREHISAKWIRDLYMEYPSEIVAMLVEVDEAVIWKRAQNAFDQTVKAFCASCNNGWMSDLEQQAAAIMRDMILPKNTLIELNYAEQRIISTWATKTAFVIKQIDRIEYKIPCSVYNDFYLKKQPSSNILVILGARDNAIDSRGQPGVMEYLANSIKKDSGAIHYITYVVGAVYFSVIIFVDTPRRIPERWRLNVEVARRLNLVWPSTSPTVLWPAGVIDDIGGINGVLLALKAATGMS